MALTTVVRGRAYDWSHAIGRGAATGTGFNYVQTMCLGKDGDLYTSNRGNENNFGMRVNRIRMGGPGDEELVSEFFQHGEGDGKATWPFGVAVGNDGRVYCSDEWTNTISVFDANGKFQYKFGKTGSGDGELMRPAGIAVENNGNVIVVDSGNCRLQVFSPEGKLLAQCGKAGSGDGEFNQPWGITTDKDGNIYVADWKNHRVQKLSPQGKFLMKIGTYGELPRSGGCLCGDLSGAVRLQSADVRLSEGRAAQPPDRCRGRSGRRYLCHRLGQPSGVHLRGRRHAADQPVRRRTGVLEVGQAERRCQPGHDEGVSPGA